MRSAKSWFFPLLFLACGPTDELVEAQTCNAAQELLAKSYPELIRAFPADVVNALVDQPAADGALGRNRAGYVHARFQFSLRTLSDYALYTGDRRATDAFLLAANYAFDRQLPDGGFRFVPPTDLASQPDYRPPSEGERASGSAFFAYSLGSGLLHLDAGTTEILRPGARRLLDHLLASKELLLSVDHGAPNRLLFNSLAYYSLGYYLGDATAVELGTDFARAALLLRDPSTGYFVEGGGWDSSYNGVALMLATELYVLLTANGENERLPELSTAVRCAANWQASRVLASGEISTRGNTRVFPGGETFVGREKDVDVVKTVRAFFYLHELTGEAGYSELAQRILSHYR